MPDIGGWILTIKGEGINTSVDNGNSWLIHIYHNLSG